ncbi:hypothetical protein DC083_07485 [Ignatzschineria ureiclastica]|uniref:Uncharacterized protein n=1 Tax=Ignatzschineria ureiclastica TaxID=472582 RepID=A0A2U2AE46_9GAMM|nr:hypothetical protein [Ignatzschineria ureiclastica]PWD80935.1 hypothetical protein DC083_07485 [Ignatzschineria ureiclastica]GGZ93779.1 hypothetical protein GCM10007162_06590 [Ignatzschineria ureiclastica]
MSMELLIVVGFFAIAVIGYIVSLFFLSKEGVKKLWMSLLLIAFVIMLVSLIVIRFDTSGFLADPKLMSEFYFAYFVIVALIVLGIVNIWAFKKVIWRVLTGKPLNFETPEELREREAEKAEAKQAKEHK